MSNHSYITLSNLAMVIAGTKKDEFSELAFFQEKANPAAARMAEAIAVQRTADETAAFTAAAKEIVRLNNVADATIACSRNRIAQLRREIEIERVKLKKTCITKMYGEKTMNWIPLSLMVGYARASDVSEEVCRDITSIPVEEYAALSEAFNKKIAVSKKKKG